MDNDEQEESRQQKDALIFLEGKFVYKRGGAVMWLVRLSDGKRSGRFHHIFLKDGIVMGQLGAGEEAIFTPQNELIRLGPSERREIEEKQDRLDVLNHLGPDYSFERLGACTQLFRISDRRCSGKFHRFYMHKGEVWGQLGATCEPIFVAGVLNPHGPSERDEM